MSSDPVRNSPAREGAMYAVFTSVDTPEGATTYLGITPSLAGDAALDPKRALEVPGASRFYAPEAGGRGTRALTPSRPRACSNVDRGRTKLYDLFGVQRPGRAFYGKISEDLF